MESGNHNVNSSKIKLNTRHPKNYESQGYTIISIKMPPLFQQEAGNYKHKSTKQENYNKTMHKEMQCKILDRT